MAKRHGWLVGALDDNGFQQRDLARAWKVDDAVASRFINSGKPDLTPQRQMMLAQMLGLTNDQLLAKLYGDDAADAEGHSAAAAVARGADPADAFGGRGPGRDRTRRRHAWRRCYRAQRFLSTSTTRGDAERSAGTWRLRTETGGTYGRRPLQVRERRFEDAQRRRYTILNNHEEGTFAQPKRQHSESSSRVIASHPLVA